MSALKLSARSNAGRGSPRPLDGRDRRSGRVAAHGTRLSWTASRPCAGAARAAATSSCAPERQSTVPTDSSRSTRYAAFVAAQLHPRPLIMFRRGSSFRTNRPKGLEFPACERSFFKHASSEPSTHLPANACAFPRKQDGREPAYMAEAGHDQPVRPDPGARHRQRLLHESSRHRAEDSRK